MSKKEFTKNDLKSGYVVELRGGLKMIVSRVNQDHFHKILVCPTSNADLRNYNDNLEWSPYASPQDDIIRVWGLSEEKAYSLSLDHLETRPLLWERHKKLLNCKIVVTNIHGVLWRESLTVGKVYEIKDGILNANDDLYPKSGALTSIDDLKQYFSPEGKFSFAQIDFIQIVED